MYGLFFVLIVGGCVGFYDGFFGLVVGLFYVLVFVMLCGFNFVKVMVYVKLFNVMLNIGGLLLFIFGGKVIWVMGFVMLVG